MGLSQLNELLLSLGYDRVSESFFAYLSAGVAEYEHGMAIETIDDLRRAVDKFRVHALLRYGNIKFAFKTMCYGSLDEIQDAIDWSTPRTEEAYRARHAPLHPIIPIPVDKTYLLGYLVDGKIQELEERPETQDQARNLKNERDRYRRTGEANHLAYLASDHMDVYVATSMREPHEYLAVSRVSSAIFNEPSLRSLNPRYFDPTQAYCVDRIDKGIAEALMLKRAKCTIYLAQESDTLGKDSELASTLAQGKPVIAYVPSFSDEEALEEVERAIGTSPFSASSSSRVEALLRFAKLIDPKVAWDNADVLEWILHPEDANEADVEKFVVRSLRRHYDKRADTLKERHPLGIQVHLETGVANGVLVARTVKETAELVRRIMLNRLEFRIDRVEVAGKSYLLLRETVTESVFRVVSGDEALTNAFWNYYVER